MAQPPRPAPAARSVTGGVFLALGAFGMWGVFPVYFKAVASVPAAEVLCHRIVWSALFGAILITALGQWPAVAEALARRRIVLTLAASAIVVSCNWVVFIWAVAHDHVLESSLGYYISPLVNVLLGTIVLHERLDRLQWIAVAIAAAGVLYQTIALGTLPWISLALAVSWGLYGLIRKVVEVEALPGLFIETLILTPFALAWLGWLAAHGSGAFGAGGAYMDVLLALSGVLTAMPLILFVAGARRLPLTTLGLLQYTVPTLHFLMAVVVFKEPFGPERLVTFACIWLGLALYSTATWRHRPATKA
ncbi:MAG: EamA family transporter RarD [Rhodospirillales bacterium]|nr:EamA family transporter RarD [Rhodospirillales bacterium]